MSVPLRAPSSPSARALGPLNKDGMRLASLVFSGSGATAALRSEEDFVASGAWAAEPLMWAV